MLFSELPSSLQGIATDPQVSELLVFLSKSVVVLGTAFGAARAFYYPVTEGFKSEINGLKSEINALRDNAARLEKQIQTLEKEDGKIRTELDENDKSIRIELGLIQGRLDGLKQIAGRMFPGR